MSFLLKEYVLLFFVGAFLGWCMEVICKLIQFRRFINRGFLIGPVCPIYGFGAVLVTALLSRYADNPFAVFGLAMLVCGTLEYLTSYAMEKLFHARWWDYSQKRFNLNGRVCANTLIPFGLLGLTLIYFVKPLLFGWFGTFSASLLDGLCYGLIALLVTDTTVSAWVLLCIRRNAENTPGDSTESITQAVRAHLAQEGLLVRRTLRAFPYVRLYNRRLLARLNEQRQALRQEIKAAKKRVHEDILRREEQLREDIKHRKEGKR